MTIASAVFQGDKSIVDTHCHYNLAPLSDDWRSHWQKAQQYGVRAAWIPGTSLDSSKVAVEIASHDPNLWALIGIHPSDEPADTVSVKEVVSELETLIERDKALDRPKIIGVGEIGLDYFRLDAEDKAQRLRQRELLLAQLQLAVKHDLLISLHVRDKQSPDAPTDNNAYWDIVKTLSVFPALPPLILHCVSGPPRYVELMLERGAFVSFAGNVTYPNAAALRELWGLVPPDRRLIETDAPYLAPQAYRGQPCEPWMISATAAFLATEAVLG